LMRRTLRSATLPLVMIAALTVALAAPAIAVHAQEAQHHWS
jgi:hypothetical protein